jgi:hypothetical protein
VERDLFDIPEEDSSTRHWKISRMEGNAGKKLERTDCGKTEKIERFLSLDPNGTNYTRRKEEEDTVTGAYRVYIFGVIFLA